MRPHPWAAVCIIYLPRIFPCGKPPHREDPCSSWNGGASGSGPSGFFSSSRPYWWKSFPCLPHPWFFPFFLFHTSCGHTGSAWFPVSLSAVFSWHDSFPAIVCFIVSQLGKWEKWDSESGEMKNVGTAYQFIQQRMPKSGSFESIICGAIRIVRRHMNWPPCQGHN